MRASLFAYFVAIPLPLPLLLAATHRGSNWAALMTVFSVLAFAYAWSFMVASCYFLTSTVRQDGTCERRLDVRSRAHFYILSSGKLGLVRRYRRCWLVCCTALFHLRECNVRWSGCLCLARAPASWRRTSGIHGETSASVTVLATTGPHRRGHGSSRAGRSRHLDEVRMLLTNNAAHSADLHVAKAWSGSPPALRDSDRAHSVQADTAGLLAGVRRVRVSYLRCVNRTPAPTF